MIFFHLPCVLTENMLSKSTLTRPHMESIRRRLLIVSDTRQIYRLLWSQTALTILIII